MRKVMILILGVIAFLTVNVNAKELDVPSLATDGLCMSSEGNDVIVSFKLGEGVQSKAAYSMALETLDGETLQALNGNYAGTKSVFKKVSSVTCKSTVEGTDIAEGDSIGAGDIIYLKFTDVDTTKKIFARFAPSEAAEIFDIVYDPVKDEFPYFFDMSLYRDTDTKLQEYAKEKYQNYLSFEIQCYNCSPYIYLNVNKDETNIVAIGRLSYYDGNNSMGWNYEGNATKTFEETKTALDNLIKNWKPNLEWIEHDVELGYTSSIKDALNSTGKLKALAGAQTTSIDRKDDKGKILYSWSFSNDKLGEVTPTDLNILVGDSSLKDTIESLIDKDKNYLLTEFTYHGELPEGTNVRINVEDKYANGDKLSLYYYNPETNKLEIIHKNLEVSDGYVEFTLEHCSNYVLVNESFPDEENNSSEQKVDNSKISIVNTVLYITIAISSLIVIVCLSKKVKTKH